MTDIALPQSPSDSREVMRSIDETGTVQFSQVGFQELDFGAVFGGKTTSTSQNSIAYGLQTFTLDIDDGKIIRGCKVEITSLDDTDCWEIGIVASKDLTVSPAAITVFIKKISPLVNTSKNWEIQIVDDAAANVATLGYSADSKQFGASNDIFVGATVSVTTDASKLFNSGSHIVFEALLDGTQYFRGISQAYNASTGALSVFVTDVSSTSGTYTAWALSAQDGPNADATSLATSTTSQTISDGFIQRTFTTQSGKTYAQGGLIKAQSASNAANVISGQILSYSSTTLVMNTFYVSGSGSPTDWILTGVPGPLGNANAGAYSLFANFASGGIGINSQSGGHPIYLQNISDSGSTAGTPLAAINFKYDDQVGLVGVVPLLSFKGNGAGTSSGTLWTGQTNLTNMSATARTITMAGDATISGTNTGDQNLSGYLTSATAASTYVPKTTTVNGHALSANVTVAYADLAAGALANGTTATTQSAADNSTKVATTAYADRNSPLAVFDVTVTPAQISGNLSSVASNVATWSQAHGLTTGQQVSPLAGTWSGVTLGQVYPVNVISNLTFTFHNNLDDAKTGANPVVIAAGSGTRTLRSYTCASARNNGLIGLDTACPVGFNPGTTTMEPLLSLASAPSVVPVPNISVNGLADATGVTSRFNVNVPVLSNSNKTITYSNAAILTVRATPAIASLTTLANQANNAFRLVGVIN